MLSFDHDRIDYELARVYKKTRNHAITHRSKMVVEIKDMKKYEAESRNTVKSNKVFLS